MRTSPSSRCRSLLPLVFGLVVVAACDAVSGPEAPARKVAANSGIASSGMVAATTSASVQSVERPYAAKLVWSTYLFVTAVQSGDPLFGGRCSIRSRYVEFGNLSGELTHAGRSVGTGSHCVQGTPQTGITFSDGSLTFTTANGDVLTFSYGGGTVSLESGLFVLESKFSVTGGTGRFEGASGAGTQRGEANATPPEVLRGAPIQLDQAGTITYAPGRGPQ